MSPYVRQAMMTSKYVNKAAKAKGISGKKTSSVPVITAFVRTTDEDVLKQQGCKIYARWADVVIASIPLDRLSTLAAMPQVKRIEAGKSCFVTNDTTATITHARSVWNLSASRSQSSSAAKPSIDSERITGSGVVVGAMDVGFDLTHPTFYSADGKTYRIKQMWDQLDLTKGGEAVTDKDTIYVGRQYIGTDSLLNKLHSCDGLLTYHGTHTTATAAGSGWEGSVPTMASYSGMAPDADICLVCNVVGDNADLIPDSLQYMYTSATDMLGFKYIFDYAQSVGKPCVINFSEGAYDDLYQSGIYSEVLSKMVGPGRIICASAGNEGNADGTYIHKVAGSNRRGAFLAKGASNVATYCLLSTKPVQMRLSFYKDKQKAMDREFDLTELSQYPDSLMEEMVDVNGDSIMVMLQTYPYCYNESLYATDLILVDTAHKKFGYEVPTSLTLLGEENDIEAFCGGGYFVSNQLDDTLLSQFDHTHNILFPGSAKDVICVGSSSYRTTFKNSAGKWRSPYGTNNADGSVSYYSSVGPTFDGSVKPDVIAPGQNIISAYNSFYREANPEKSLQDDVCDFTYNNRQYQWHALSGTSMSTPVVTGIIALWLQICPTLTPDQVKDVMAHTCTHYDETLQYPNNHYGWGQIDALAGIEYIRQNYTGIAQIENEERGMNGRDAIYTVEGRRVESTDNKHGLFIVVKDGKARKVVKR